MKYFKYGTFFLPLVVEPRLALPENATTFFPTKSGV